MGLVLVWSQLWHAPSPGAFGTSGAMSVGVDWLMAGDERAAHEVLVLLGGLGEMEQRNAAATTFYCLVLWVQVFSSGFSYCSGTE